MQVAMALIALSAWMSAAEEEPARPVKEIQGDVHINDHVEWRDADYRIHGSVWLHDGGELLIENARVDLMCTYTREFRYQWDGGTLVTRGATLGGSESSGAVYQTVFEIQHGTWEAEDTTVQYSSGITLGWTGFPVKFHAIRLHSGPHPDSVIMSSGASDVVLRDSDFNVSLYVSAKRGGKGELELPSDGEPISRVFDPSNVPGVRYRLELINTTVPLWWVFFGGIADNGPPTEVVLGNCPRLIPSLMAENLRGTLHLPSPWPPKPGDVASLTFGNLTLRTTGKTVNTWCWGIYLSGDKTDAVLDGATTICELMISGGRLVMQGDPGTYNAQNACTTVEVGHVKRPMDIDKNKPDKRTKGKPVELIIKNASLGRFAKNDPIIGQITAHRGGRVKIEHARCANLKLITKENGKISLPDCVKRGTFTLVKDGGPIVVKDR